MLFVHRRFSLPPSLPKKFDPDMIGLGPYIVQAQTPLGQIYLAERQNHSAEQLEEERKALLERTTRMYALARLTLGNVNIAATTALQALDPQGREVALRRGANVVMPIITPQRLRGKGGRKGGLGGRGMFICFRFKVAPISLLCVLHPSLARVSRLLRQITLSETWSYLISPILAPPFLPQANTKSTKTNLASIKTLCRARHALTFACSWREKSYCWMGNGTIRLTIWSERWARWKGGSEGMLFRGMYIRTTWQFQDIIQWLCK